jgi:hypothetical protein
MTDEEIQMFREMILDFDAVIVGADVTTVSGPAGELDALNAKELFRPVVGEGETACPDPADESVRYVAEDPEDCRAIRFACEDGEELFSDECGCGCVSP